MSEPWFVRRYAAKSAEQIAGIKISGEYEPEATQKFVSLTLSASTNWMETKRPFVLIDADNNYGEDIRAISWSDHNNSWVLIDERGDVFDGISSKILGSFGEKYPRKYLNTKHFIKTGKQHFIVGNDDLFFFWSEGNNWHYIGQKYLEEFPQKEEVNNDVETNPAYNFWDAATVISADDLWVAGWRARILHWDGIKFSDHSYTEPSLGQAEVNFTDILHVSDDEIYICGYDSLRANGPSLILKGNKKNGFKPVFQSFDRWAFFSMAYFQGKVLVADFSLTHQGVYELRDGKLIPFLPPSLSDFRGASYLKAFGDVLWVAGPHEVLRLSNNSWERYPHQS